LLCFAGLERDKFDNKTVSFEEHIKSEHNMWHYLYFIVLVKVKDPTEYTGPESYVAQMITVSKAALPGSDSQAVTRSQLRGPSHPCLPYLPLRQEVF
jgi:hypothetical protein